MRKNYYRFHLGNFECVSLYDGCNDYKLESMVMNVPREKVAAALQAHNLPTEIITTPYAYLYVSTGKHKVLVDMGAGNLVPTTGRLLESMYQAGIYPQGIDSIFISHAHPDHVGGALNNSGQPIYTNATYYLSKVEWDFWFSEEAMLRPGKYYTDYARKNLAPLKEKMVLLEREGEILPGVSVLFAPGHTPGHMVVSFVSIGERLMYIGDTVIQPIHLEHPDWLPVYDILPEPAGASKQHIFDLAASTGCLIHGQHFPPFPNLGHVAKKEIGWEWQPIETVNGLI